MLERSRAAQRASFVAGRFSRGHVVPAVNLLRPVRFDRAPTICGRGNRVRSEGRSVGLVVDDGREFVRLAAGAIQAPQESLAGVSGRYVEGIVSVNERLILVLRLDQLLNFAEPLIAA